MASKPGQSCLAIPARAQEKVISTSPSAARIEVDVARAVVAAREVAKEVPRGIRMDLLLRRNRGEMAQIALMTRYRTSAPHIGDKVETSQTTASASCAAIPAGAESTVCHLLRCTYACDLFLIHFASCNLFQLNWSPSGDWAAQQYSKTALTRQATRGTDSAQLLLQGSRQMVWDISRQQRKEQGVVASPPRTWAQWRAFQFPTYKQRASGPPPRYGT